MTTNALLFIGTYTEPIKFGTGQILVRPAVHGAARRRSGPGTAARVP